MNPRAALSTPMVPTLSIRSVAVVDDPLYSATNDGDGELDEGEPGIGNVTVVITDRFGSPQTVTTDSNGEYEDQRD